MSAGSDSNMAIVVPQPPLRLQVSPLDRLRCVARLILELRTHDFRAARTFVRSRYPDSPWPIAWSRFTGWALQQMWSTIPEAMTDVTFADHVSRIPMWLAEGNPLANHPWTEAPTQTLPIDVDVLVIGAGFTGASLAYHWSKKAGSDQSMAVVEMDDPASGASGRNEGLVVMGRYYAMVRDTVKKSLASVRSDLHEKQQQKMSEQFAAVYSRAAYRNAEMVEQTIRYEQFDCDYARTGWVQARTKDEQAKLDESICAGEQAGFSDWTKIGPQDVYTKTGMHVDEMAGFSRAAASFHPAKWVWSLIKVGLKSNRVQLFTRTRVQGIKDMGDHYLVQTNRGSIRAKHVVSATESYTPMLHRQFSGLIQPTQTQAASGKGGPETLRPNIGISGSWIFAGRHGTTTMIGSDSTRVPDHHAGRFQPSRFLTKFLCGELKRLFGSYRLRITHEWSGTVGYTPDEYPIVGTFDGKRQHIIAGMAGSGTAVSFNAARCIVNRILDLHDEPDDYPNAYFGPTRLLDPKHHSWPELTSNPS